MSGSSMRRLRSTPLPGSALSALAVAWLAIASSARANEIVVDLLIDDPNFRGGCQLRNAILAANSDGAAEGCTAGSGSDRITFDVTGTIALTANLPTITQDLFFDGPPLDANGLPSLSINGSGHSIFHFNGSPNGRHLRIERLTIRNGARGDGGCIHFRSGDHLVLEDSRVVQCATTGEGGGIFGDNAGSMVLRRSTIAGNEAVGAGGAYFLGVGWQSPTEDPTATFLIEDCTFSGNSATTEAAGGGFASGFANGAIRRSTFSGNATQNAGGGVIVIYGLVDIDSSTITSNVADSDGDDVGAEAGGGLFVVGDPNVAATVNLRNTVIGNNFMAAVPSDVTASDFSAILSDGFNLVGVRDGAAAFFVAGAPNADEDWVGTRLSPILAGLGPLADNGGPTRTHLPSPGSLLVDHGDCPDAAADQRRYGNATTQRRPVDQPLIPDSADGCDIGAVEEGAVELADSLFSDDFESGDTGTWSATGP
jgi:hypothetical protein